MSNSYEDRLKAHLAAYKQDALAGDDDGGWARAGHSYPYVVPADKRHLNLIAGYRDGILGWLAKQPALTLQRDFHHLNSSQAMGFNLLWPAVSSPAGRAALAQALGTAAISGASPLFESSRGTAGRTRFALHLHTENGGQLFFQLKLAEHRFGDARADAPQLAELDDLHRERLQSRVRPHLLSPAALGARYPLLHDLAQLETDADRLFLVMPRGNRALHQQARMFRDEIAAAIRPQVSVLDVETLVERLQRFAPPDSPAWQAHYAEFLRKYSVAEEPAMA